MWKPTRLAAIVLLLGGAAPPQAGRDAEAALRALDGEQKAMVARADADGLAALASPALRINAPTNRILTRAQFLAMMRSGRIGAEAFERTVEDVTITGDVGIVMGSELFTPTAGSELGRTWGARPLRRRYTNVYLRDRGRWTWLARQAAIVPDGRSTAARP